MIILMADTCGGLALHTVTHLAVPQPCGQVLSFSPFTDEKTEAQSSGRPGSGPKWASSECNITALPTLPQSSEEAPA